MESAGPKEASSSLHDAIVTLPKRRFISPAVGGSAIVAAAPWLAAEGTSDEIGGGAVHTTVVMLPLMMIAGIAAGTIRRTSTRKVDARVDGFLSHPVYERLHLRCVSGKSAKPPYPFRAVDRGLIADDAA